MVIVGQDRVCYGSKLPKGQTYKQIMCQKIDLDPDRVHFVDPLPYGRYLEILQASSVHVYLTVPFILSWSLLESMSCGCLVVASDTPPVKEVIRDGVNGVLTDFFDSRKIVEKVVACLKNPLSMENIKANARKTIQDCYAVDKMLETQVNIMKQITKTSASQKKELDFTGK